ncbi:hypothetical protein SEA_BRUSACORAM_44 [Mycobacterium phage Brusacoram]|uniref:Uncharacterized protein n=9 Tax=Caudoviricetes TaxID=2731619 RepID=A0A0K1Y658_9CAUD|nr:hypothetical protein SEA_BRUSACORAM_44 [Mycobacterium phage Brusacoram]YP_009302360.1 hypothetical protein BJD69_gp46 [Mycobacterium phage Xeno]YP_009964218.1 hypothetical protein I5J38_gp43 [Mycobacterium phage Willsammy]YP_009964299.1 hypothetical protein I5J39_gp44 [Mycobacterium phage Megiddo]YP_009964377.1 hypothetical protein I5J40_gp44 [Mycobacterium phage Atcoo]YP_010001345.1 hypothetical protein J1N47_gp44 [Mycobacterium phage KilKor]YP_010051910.1 hypothetical protein KD928_gp46 
MKPTETTELDDWRTDEWWLVPDRNETEKGIGVMSYEFETDEWRRATHTMSETERAAASDAHRRSLGMVGDRDDARDEIGSRR